MSEKQNIVDAWDKEVRAQTTVNLITLRDRLQDIAHNRARWTKKNYENNKRMSDVKNEIEDRIQKICQVEEVKQKFRMSEKAMRAYAEKEPSVRQLIREYGELEARKIFLEQTLSNFHSFAFTLKSLVELRKLEDGM